MVKTDAEPTAKLRWERVPDDSERPSVTEFNKWGDGDGWVLQQWWRWQEAKTPYHDMQWTGEWRDVQRGYED